MAKGGDAENETCRELSEWWTEGKSKAVFRRTQVSGGKATVRKRKGKKTPFEYGDITFSDPVGRPLIEFLLIENKSGYKDLINALDFIDTPKKHPQLLKWWEKANEERWNSDRYYAVLIFRRTRKGKCIMMDSDLFCLLEDWAGEYKESTIDIVTKTGQWVIVRFNDLLNWIAPQTILQIMREKGWKENATDNS